MKPTVSSSQTVPAPMLTILEGDALEQLRTLADYVKLIRQRCNVTPGLALA